MNARILCVDDDRSVLEGYQRTLRKQFTIEIALGGEAGLQAIQTRGPFAVVVADMQMPGMNGIEFLGRVKEAAPTSVRFMLTGNADQATAVKAVNEGHVFQFLTKPCPADMFARALENGVAQYHLLASERDLLENTLRGSVNLLSDVLSIWDPTSFGQGQRLRELMRHISESWRGAPTWELELGAMLSPVGYATVPSAVLEKYRAGLPLTETESDALRRAPDLGSNLITNIPRLENVARIVRYQDKHFDGSGFPADEVAGRSIPIGARILKVLIDMLHLEGRGMTRADALLQMQSRAGVYDPMVLNAAIARFEASPSPTDGPESTVITVAFRALATGQTIARRVETLDGQVVAGAGMLVTPVLLERLRNFHRSVGVQEPLFILA
jgi:response regulator RpfG family c-di-GMP phosphodiesterase